MAIGVGIGAGAFPSGSAQESQGQAAPHEVVQEIAGAATVAFVNLDRSPVGALLQDRLCRKQIVNWWPRDEAEELGRDLELTLIPAVTPKVVRGAPLPCPDALILSRTRVQGVERLVDVVVCDPQMGLRLGSTRLALSTDLSSDLDRLATFVAAALSKLEQPLTELWTVPEFRSNDLGERNDPMRRRCAEIVAEELLVRRGAFLTELEFAHAIARLRDKCGLEDPIRRVTPLALLGEFRHEQTAERPSVSLRLFLEERDPEKMLAQTASADKVEPALRALAKQAASRLGGSQNLAEKDPQAELKQLALLGVEYERTGDPIGKIRTLEVSLLLQPANLDLRCALLSSLGGAMRSTWPRLSQITTTRTISEELQPGIVTQRSFANPQLEKELAKAIGALNQYRHGLWHLAQVTADRAAYKLHAQQKDEKFVWDYFLGYQGLTARPDTPPTLVHLGMQVAMEQREAWIRYVRNGAEDGRAALPPVWAGLSVEDRAALALRLIVELQQYPRAETRTVNYAFAIVQSNNLQSPVGQRLLDQLAAIPNPEIQRGVKNVRSQLAESVLRAEERREAASATGNHSSPITDPRFQQLKLNWAKDGDRSADAEGQAELCLPAGSGVDLFCRHGQILSMRRKGETELLWDGKDDTIRFWSAGQHHSAPALACFDGRYAWLPLIADGKPPRLLAIDPEASRFEEFTVNEGLPPDLPNDGQRRPIVAIAPLAPGKVLVIGWFGQTWLATAELDPHGRKSFHIIHEARDQPAGNDPEEWRSTTLAFEPVYLHTLTQDGAKEPGRRILVGRGTRARGAFWRPLVVNPESLTIEVFPSWIDAEGRKQATVHLGALNWIRARELHTTNRLIALNAEFLCASLPNLEQVSLGKMSIEGGPLHHQNFFSSQGKLHWVTDRWLVADAADHPFRTLIDKLPRGLLTTRHFTASNHYGLVVQLSDHRIYAVDLGENSAPK